MIAKEDIFMTHGQEQQCGDCLNKWEVLRRAKREKWDNCYSRNNKINLN